MNMGSATPWVLALLLCGTPVPLPGQPGPTQPEREGAALVAELLSRGPAEDYAAKGTLRIRRKGKATVELPVEFQVTAGRSGWASTYQVPKPRDGSDLSALTVVHQVGAPSRYYRGIVSLNSPNEACAIPLSPLEVASAAFAGSDFTAGDLGLEFLHWPIQRLVKKEMRRSQFCNVLESVNPQAPPGSYSRVLAWLDKDTGAIMVAEGYDASGKMIKEFRPKSVKKIAGEYQLQEMEMRDRRNGSRTNIRFDLSED